LGHTRNGSAAIAGSLGAITGAISLVLVLLTRQAAHNEQDFGYRVDTRIDEKLRPLNSKLTELSRAYKTFNEDILSGQTSNVLRNITLNRHFSQVIQESCVGVASDSGRDDFMNLVNLVIKNAPCGLLNGADFRPLRVPEGP
jgi:hypothetical protein